MSEIQNSNSIKISNNQNNINGNTSIKQNLNVSGFKTFQSKVASKSLCRRAIGFITGAAGAAGAAVGGIFAIKVGVAAMVGALAGLVGAAAAPFVLIGMGALCIAAIIGGIVLFAKNSKENVYIRELKNLLQSENVNDKKRAISYLNEMISKHNKEGSVEYNATVRFLNENTEIFKLCLGSKDRELFDGIAKFLINVSKNECEKTECAIKLIIEDCLNSTDNTKNDNATKILTEMLKNGSNNTKSLACEIVKSKGFSENIQRFLKSKNNDLKTNTISLLSEILKNGVTKSAAEEIIKDYIKSDNTRSMDNAIGLLTALSKDGNIQTNVVQIVENCIEQEDLELKSNTIKLLTEMLKNKNTQTHAEEIIKNYSARIGVYLELNLALKNDQLKANTIALLTEMLKNKNTQTHAEEIIKKYSEKIGGWLGSGNDQLKANTIALLTEMFKSENTDLANIAKKIITTGTDEGFVIESQSFSDIIKGWLKSRDDGLKIKTVELLNEMLVDSNEGLEKKSREILKSDVLNTKGMLNIFLNDKGKVNEEAISLLSPMSKDWKIKGILSGLIGKDLVKKLEGQRNDIKSADVVNVLYENVIVKGIFSEGNKKHIIDLLKNQDGLHSIDINFDKNGQITEVKREELESFFNEKELNLKALKKQSIEDFGRCLKSIAVNKNVIEISRNKNDNNREILENAFKEGNIDEETKKLIYKFPGQSAISTSPFLLFQGSEYLGNYRLKLSTLPGSSKSDSYYITVNNDGSVEVQTRYISHVVMREGNNLPMVIEEVHTFKINKGKGTYKTTNAKIIVYKLENTSIQLTEENLKKQKVLSEVSYNGDENNNEDNKKE